MIKGGNTTLEGEHDNSVVTNPSAYADKDRTPLGGGLTLLEGDGLLKL